MDKDELKKVLASLSVAALLSGAILTSGCASTQDSS